MESSVFSIVLQKNMKKKLSSDQFIVYRPLILHGATAKAIQCIVHPPVTLHKETTKAIQFILYRSVVLPQLKFVQFLAAQQAQKMDCKHERVSPALLYSMYISLTIDPGTLFNQLIKQDGLDSWTTVV